jgi:hypothetical protein
MKYNKSLIFSFVTNNFKKHKDKLLFHLLKKLKVLLFKYENE